MEQATLHAAAPHASSPLAAAPRPVKAPRVAPHWVVDELTGRPYLVTGDVAPDGRLSAWDVDMVLSRTAARGVQLTLRDTDLRHAFLAALPEATALQRRALETTESTAPPYDEDEDGVPVEVQHMVKVRCGGRWVLAARVALQRGGDAAPPRTAFRRVLPLLQRQRCGNGNSNGNGNGNSKAAPPAFPPAFVRYFAGLAVYACEPAAHVRVVPGLQPLQTQPPVWESPLEVAKPPAASPHMRAADADAESEEDNEAAVAAAAALLQASFDDHAPSTVVVQARAGHSPQAHWPQPHWPQPEPHWPQAPAHWPQPEPHWPQAQWQQPQAQWQQPQAQWPQPQAPWPQVAAPGGPDVPQTQGGSPGQPGPADVPQTQGPAQPGPADVPQTPGGAPPQQQQGQLQNVMYWPAGHAVVMAGAPPGPWYCVPCQTCASTMAALRNAEHIVATLRQQLDSGSGSGTGSGSGSGTGSPVNT